MPTTTVEYPTQSIEELTSARVEATGQMEEMLAKSKADKVRLTAEQREKFMNFDGAVKLIDAEFADRRGDDACKAAMAAANLAGSDPAGGRLAGEGGGSASPLNKKKRIFSSLGEQMATIATSRRTGQIDARLVKVQNQQGANETVPSEGGFFVEEDYGIDLMTGVYGAGLILPRVSETPLSGNSNTLKLRLIDETSRQDGFREGGVEAYWEAEGAPLSPTQRKFRLLTLEAEKLTALTYITDELLQDYSAMEAETVAAFNREMLFQLEQAVIRGDGVGKPKGILNADAKVEVVPKDATPTANSTPFVFYDDIVNMWSRLHPNFGTEAVWLVDPSMIPQLQLMYMDMGGTFAQAVYIPPNGAAAAPFGTLMGRPIVVTEHTDVVGTPGDIVLWGPSSYRMVTKGGMKQASSIHVAFLTDEVAYRWTTRANGDTKWKAALTPNNGGPTLAPIVTLGTRV